MDERYFEFLANQLTVPAPLRERWAHTTVRRTSGFISRATQRDITFRNEKLTSVVLWLFKIQKMACFGEVAKAISLRCRCAPGSVLLQDPYRWLPDRFNLDNHKWRRVLGLHPVLCTAAETGQLWAASFGEPLICKSRISLKVEPSKIAQVIL